MSVDELLAGMRALNRRFETPGDSLYEDNEALHSEMDALLLSFTGIAEATEEFDKHTKWYA